MIARPAIGWQTMLADLSLILFMVTAAAMAEPPPPARPRPQPVPAAAFSPSTSPVLNDPARAQPVAVWRAAPGGIGLGPWLATQQVDSRQQLTITLRYPQGRQTDALSQAAELMREAAPARTAPRIVIEPEPAGTPVEVMASLAYDRAGQQ